MAFKTKNILFRSSIILGSLVVLSVVIFVFHRAEKAKADSFLASDFNQDGIVDKKDIELIKQNYANTAGGILSPSPYDLNNDHKINSLDLAIVEDNQGNGTNPERDWDKDGYTVAENDCNDRNNVVHPLAKEKANNLDDDCDGRIDELAAYEKLSSKDVIDVNFSFSAGDTSSPILSVKSTEMRHLELESIGNRFFGDYSIVLEDANGKTLDAVFFGIPNKFLAETTSSQVLTRTITKNAGDFTISVPKTDAVKKLYLKKVSDPNFQQSIDIPSTNAMIKQADAAVSSECPPDLRGEGNERFYGILQCFNFDVPATAPIVAKISEVYSTMKKFMPGVTYIPISKMVIVNASDIAAICSIATGDATLTGCYSPQEDTLLLNASVLLDNPYIIAQTIAHELGHHYFYSAQAAALIGGMELADYEEDYLADLIALLSTVNCKNGMYCNGNIQEFVGIWPSRFVGGCEYVVCASGAVPQPAWNEDYMSNPLGISSIPSVDFPRPDVPGTVSAYAASAPHEEFAETIAGIYASNANLDTEKNFKSLIKRFTQHHPTLSVQKLMVRTSLLGEYGLIKDWDQDGVPDEYDNCSPKMFPQTCNAPSDSEQHNRCYNPDQLDLVHRDGALGPDGVGDRCELPQGSCFTACDPQGYVCNFSIGGSTGGAGGGGGVLCEPNATLPHTGTSEACRYAAPVFVDPTVPHSFSLGDVCAAYKETQGGQ